MHLQSPEVQMRGKRGIGLCAGILLLICHAPAFAFLSATATWTSQPDIQPGFYDYNVTVNNTGTTNISTYWFAWIAPPTFPVIYDLLPTVPTNVQSPNGNWIGSAIHDSFYPGYSIEWYTGSAPIAPGQSLSGFKFTSDQTPAQIAGPSPEFTGFNEQASYVYIGASQTDSGAEFDATPAPTPEPAIGLLAAPAVLLLLRRRRGV